MFVWQVEWLRAWFARQQSSYYSMMCPSLATLGTEACDAGGTVSGAEWSEWPAPQL